MIRSSVNPVLPANQWTTFSIPLSKFIGLASGTIDRVDIMNDGSPRLWYVDAVGFTTSASGATTTVAEKIFPTVALSGVTQGGSVSGMVPLMISATDSTGISRIQIKVDGALRGSISIIPASYSYLWDTTKVTNGPHSIQAVGVDGWGNTAMSAPITVLVNNPIVSRPSAAPAVLYADSPVFPWTVSSSRAIVDPSYAVNTYQGRGALAVDALSNGKVMFLAPSPVPMASYRYVEFAVYATGTQRIYPMARVNGKFITLTSVATVANTWKFFSLPLPAVMATSGMGLDYLEFRSDGYARRWLMDEIRFVSTSSIIDIDSPAVSLISPLSGAVVSGTVALSASATDNVGIKGVTFKVDGARIGAEDLLAPYSVSWNTTNVVKGTHSVWAEARDAAGNKSATQIAVVTVTTVPDLSAPTIPSGLFARAISSTQIDLSWYAARDNIGVVGYRVYRNGAVSGTTTSTKYSDVGLVASISYAYQITAYDAAGNESVKSAVITGRTLGTISTSTTGDRVSPSVSISVPLQSASISGTTAIRAVASDNVGVSGVQFQVDGANLMAEDTTTPYEISWDTRSVSNGTHQLKAIARDAAGNRTISLTRTVSVLNAVPTSTPTSTSAGFVSVQNGKFYLDGNPFYFGATNAYWLFDQQGITFENGSAAVATAVAHQLDRSREIGIRVIRMWAFNDDAGRQATLQTSPGVYNETIFRALDLVIREARTRGIKLILSLVNHQPEYGGARKYVEWAGLANVGDFYTNANVKQLFKNHISVMLNRTNTYTGVKYKDDPTIMAWEMVNEASNESGGSNVDPVPLRDFYSEIARYIKSIDPNHLVTTGEEGFDHSRYVSRYSTYANNWVHRADERGTSYYLNTNVPEVDFAQVHMYPAAWAMQPGQESLRWITEHASIAAAAGKPLIVGEYGISDHAQYTDWLATAEQTDAVGGMFLWQYGASGAPWYYMQNSGMQIREGDADESILIGHHARMNAKQGGGATSTPDTTPPSVPAGFFATPISSSQINLSWSASTDAIGVAGYRVYRGGVQIGTADGTSYQNTGLTASTTYSYAVAAYDAVGNLSARSVPVSVTTFVGLPPTSTPTSTLFRVGSRVRTTANLNVRTMPSPTGVLVGTQASGALGTVTGGAVAAGGYQWWSVNFDAGADGWSAEDWLALATTTPPISTSTASSSLWVSAYLNSWDLRVPGTAENDGDYTSDEIDWSAFTHLIFFATNVYGDGTCCRVGDINANYNQVRIDAIVAAAHAHGKPILISIGGAGASGFSTAIANATTRTALVNSLFNHLVANRYDGIDLDPEEGTLNTANLVAFSSELRAKLNTINAFYDSSKKPLLTAAIYNSRSAWAAASASFDQINLMSYDLMGNELGETWHNNAAKNVRDANGACSTIDYSEQNGGCLYTIEDKYLAAKNAGIPVNKIGGGISLNGYLQQGGLNLAGTNGPITPRDRWSQQPTMRYLQEWNGVVVTKLNESVYYALKKYLFPTFPATSFKRDTTSNVPYVSVDKPGTTDDLYISYSDAESVRNAVRTIKSLGLGGMIIWEIGGGYLGTENFPPTQYPGLVRDELLQAVKKEWLGLP